MSATIPAPPRVFVSHSHKDDAFTQRLVDDLTAAGASVWVDKQGIRHGNFMQEIDKALASCDWMVLVLTPNAIASPYVKDEVYTALHRVKQGYMRAVIPILATACVPSSIPPQWDVLHRYDGTRDYDSAVAGIIRAIGLHHAKAPRGGAGYTSPTSQLAASASPHTAQRVTLPPERLPPSLVKLDFAGYVKGNTKFILAPVCTVAAGPFLMGSDQHYDKEASDEEKPAHQVTLVAYQIGRFPVTVAEYACFVDSGHAEPPKGEHGVDWRTQLTCLDHPVTCITWQDAVAYAAWLAQITGQLWYLPTEAEWEKAARWDPKRNVAHLYPWGDKFNRSRCNSNLSGKLGTTPVSAYPNGASPCGALDMVGNVREWTNSRFKPYPYNARDGREVRDLKGSRVQRGGAYFDHPWGVRTAVRDSSTPENFHQWTGFRLALG